MQTESYSLPLEALSVLPIVDCFWRGWAPNTCRVVFVAVLLCRYADPQSPKKQPELVQQADGLFVRHLPAALLREMNIVDTPGTNVILERQQRLTGPYGGLNSCAQHLVYLTFTQCSGISIRVASLMLATSSTAVAQQKGDNAASLRYPQRRSHSHCLAVNVVFVLQRSMCLVRTWCCLCCLLTAP